MSGGDFSWTRAVLTGIAVLTTGLFGVASLWATNRRVGWIARVAPVTVLLAGLLPVGTFELVLVFGSEALFVVGGVGMARRWRRWRQKRRENAEPAPDDAKRRWLPRFKLTDLLKAVALGAVVLAPIRNTPEEWGLYNWGTPAFWWKYLVFGAMLAALTLAAQTLAQARRWRAIAIAALLVAVSTAVMAWTGDSTDLFWGLERRWWRTLSLVAVPVLLIAGWQYLLAKAGWGWWGEPSATALSHEGAAAPARRIGRRAARAALVAVALACLLPLADVYRGLLPPRDRPKVKLPKPNGYDELVRAATLLNWNAVPNQDAESASARQCAQFVQDNGAALDVFRKALAIPSHVPVNYDSFYHVPLTNVQHLRGLARAHLARAKASTGAGRPKEACDALLDCIRMSNPMCRGGLFVDELVADAIESVGAEGIAPLLDRVDDETLAVVGQEAERALRGREAVPHVLARERRYMQSAYGWTGRLDGWFKDRGIGCLWGFDDRVQMTEARARRNARLKLLIAEAALYRYMLVHGEAPDTLAALVPDYLPDVPIDPFSGQPLRYRRTETGYVVYSIGQDRVDDGGVPTKADDAERRGDLLLAP